MSADDSSTGDDASASLFGDAAHARAGAYEVLARKYRPRRFEDLIGQEAMVRTLSNAFETGRIAHGFMLTGVRGIGKTTTARLLARALNYEPAEGTKGKKGKGESGPSIHLDPPGVHCEAIMASRHPDVLELDAASRTGVADMRDLLDSSRYGPVSARYKVYIIDEVHMLSTASFNALLKTLEEPPPHLKFIFATTEIRKVPVTVLSRCQRFDLKRLDTPVLAQHLSKIAKNEKAKVSEEAIALVARAAEGSVRDGLSLLDQAIVQTPDGDVSGAAVRDMLGLGDRTRLYDVFEKAITSDAKGALAELKDQVSGGADPAVVLKDLMDIAADVSIAQATGDSWIMAGPADWASRTRALAQRLTPAQAARTWQILLSGYGDLQVAPDPATALNMVVLRLAAASSLPSPEEAARMIAEGAGPPGKASAPLEASPTMPGGIASFADIVRALTEAREVALQVDTERYIRFASVSAGRLSYALAPGAPPGLAGRLKIFLDNETSLDWQITESETDAESLRERERREKAERIAAAKEHPFIAATLNAIPGAVILDVTDDTAPLENPAPEGNVIDIRTRRPA
ncbi:MAG: DNA polymerase III subunit gamma/tau [Hyphomonas sp.]